MAALWKKVSDMLGISNNEIRAPPLDGEIIYCKNNVCVHPPTKLSNQIEHHPGYLTIRAQEDEDVGSTLILTWIPNSSLKKSRKKAARYLSPHGSPMHARFARAKQTSADGISLSSLGSVSQDSVSIASSEAERVISFELLKEKLERKHREAQGEASVGDRPEPADDVEQNEQGQEVLNNVKRPSKEKLPGIGQHVNELNEKNNISKAESCSSASSDTVEGNEDREGDFTPAVPDSLAINVDRDATPSDSDVSPGYGVVREVGKLAVEHQPLLSESDDGGRSDVGEMSPTKDRRPTPGNDEWAARDAAHGGGETSGGAAPIKPDSNDRMQAHGIEVTGSAQAQEEQSYNKEMNKVTNNVNLLASPAKSDSNSSTDSEVMQTENQLHDLLQKSGLEEGESQNLNEEIEKPERPSELNVNMKKVIHTAVGDFEEDSPSSDSTNASPYPSPYKSLMYEPNAEKTVLHVDPSLSAAVHSDASSSTTPTTSNRDPMSLPSTPSSSEPPTPSHSERQSPVHSIDRQKSIMEGNPESLAMTHNLTFPDNSVSYASPQKKNLSPKDQLLGVFSVDLSEMRSLRLFFSDDNCTCGQLVIASRESQYKIIHFHHGGLDRLAEVFEDWKICVQQKEKRNSSSEGNQLCRKFSICRPHLPPADCHPEESMYEMVSDEVWWSYVNDYGQIEDDEGLRKAIFFGGLDEYLRRDVWPFLLGYFSYDSTVEERNAMRGKKREEYYSIQDKREAMSGEEYEQFYRNVQCTVDKDVVRTDRSHPYFRGENNPNIDVMRNILLNYAIFNPEMGYSQGMSDLLSPVLAEIQDESDAFWCFVGLMQNTIFVSSPTDDDMERQLAYLRALLELILPEFWQHLLDLGDAMELLFCHRWILLCFKREFPEPDALRMWEACWAHYQSDYFHLFICVAIIAIYGADIVEQKLPSDEMLLHFSSLAMHMSGDVILRKARGLLHQFRLLPRIPCTLDGLCEMCGPGMWDSGHIPETFCIGNHEEGFKCPHSYSEENLNDKSLHIRMSPVS
ncbi:TBC1 domain family member 16-like [Ptychodera flava]|uniref:TBC1 domain family member 16-like n=1 Tax=Ptychodera flava TaxID=63121 RepID=UPI00396A7586